MNTNSNFFRYCALAVLLLLAACVNTGQQVVYPGPEAEVIAEPEPEVLSYEIPERYIRARILADMLYEARVAYEDNRLMSPTGNNAYDRYREVLDFDPENVVALQGIEEIGLRYGELATVALNEGQYDNSASLLARGERLIPGSQELARVRQQLVAARSKKQDTFSLDPAGLRSQSATMQQQLAEIAQLIRSQEATFQINARTDEEGRWIYMVMREAVEGYRLRGNIGISGTPVILVSPPPG